MMEASDCLRELEFQLFDLQQAEELCALPRFAEHSVETFRAALHVADAVAREQFAPLHRAMDEHEFSFDKGQAVAAPAMHSPMRQALAAFADAGFIAATHDTADGGMQLPFCVAMACWGLFKAANVSLETYPSLTAGVANLVKAHGTPQQRRRFLPPLLSGRWFGTMVLTEPEAGSSLADIQTQATPRADGRYSLRGRKLFITAGDHELTENIVHLVLARMAGAPPGVKGLSLFIVTKYLVNDAGELSDRNDVALAGLIHKLGYRGTTSAMLNFGEAGDGDACEAELLGRPNQGLACMFGMMNEARISVGLSAAMQGLAGARESLAYARERRQGRPDRDLASPQQPIVEHADVRRMLLAQKSFSEGALSLALMAARLHDLQAHAEAAQQRREAGQLLELLTPVVKAWASQHGTVANDIAIQVLGGYGYTRDFPLEQRWRDNRLNALHEGTNGIQALDLLGRKLWADDGAGWRLLNQQVQATLRRAGALIPYEMSGHAAELERAWSALGETTAVLGEAMRSRPREALAHAADYLNLFGHTVVAALWLDQACCAANALQAAEGSAADFYRGKLAAAAYFLSWELPQVQALHAPLRRVDAALLAMKANEL